MPSLTPTTIAALEPLLEAQIIATTPRITVAGSDGWRKRDKATAGAGRTRRFQLVWEPGNYFQGGIFTPAAVEVDAVLRVRTDYAAQQANNMHLIQDDWHQLRDRMSALTADPATGLVFVQTTRPQPVAVTAEKAVGKDVLQIDLTYQVRYLQARG